ncbi:MAG: dihydroxy-acid dehydratase [Propylenella sp.]
MADGLRGKLTNYGDPEFALFLRRAFLHSLGWDDEAFDRPIVGITNTYSDYNACHGTVPDLIEHVKRGVLSAGGIPMVFPTITIQESFAYPTSMLLRNLMAMDTEEMIRAQPMDSVVLVGGCDKTLPAQIMAAASANTPAIVLPVGPMATGRHRGRVLGACTDCRSAWAEFRAGRIGEAELRSVGARLAATPGTCTVMGTASTIALIVEGMGLTLPMAATIPATHSERKRLAHATGVTAVRMAQSNSPRPRELVTCDSLRNAQVLLQAIGGSTNAVVHLTAIARRAGIEFDLRELDRIGHDVPVVVDVKPSGGGYMEDLHAAGGLLRVISAVQDRLNLDIPTVGGTTFRELLAECDLGFEHKAVRSEAKPLHSGGAIAVLTGNLAPRGALIKQSAASPHLLRHTGRAIVFDSIEDMIDRIDRADLDAAPSDVLVMRNAGPKGAPGMPEAGAFPIPGKLSQMGVTDMVRISDSRMSGTAFGTVVLHVSPEAADGGPLARLRSGDRIELDVPNRTLNVLVAAEEFAARDTCSHQTTRPPSRGYSRLFLDHVLQADLGCDFDFLQESVADDGPGNRS